MAFGADRKIHTKFKFVVYTRNLGFAAFSQCSELSGEIGVVEYREGGALIPIKVPGLLKFTDVTLSRGASSSLDFHNWSLRVANAAAGPGGIGEIDPLYKVDDLTIEQRDRDNAPLRLWRLIGAWPTKYVAGDWDNSAEEVVIEQLTLAYDYFELAFSA